MRYFDGEDGAVNVSYNLVDKKVVHPLWLATPVNYVVGESAEAANVMERLRIKKVVNQWLQKVHDIKMVLRLFITKHRRKTLV